MDDVKQPIGSAQPQTLVELHIVDNGPPVTPTSSTPSDSTLRESFSSTADHEDDDDAEEDSTLPFAKFFFARRRLYRSVAKLRRGLRVGLSVLCLCLYFTYFSYAVYLQHDDSSRLSGLIVITVILFLVLLVRGVSHYEPIVKAGTFFSKHTTVTRYLKRFVILACVFTTCVTLVTEVIMVRPQNLVSLTGIAGIFLIFFITSTHPHKISWQPVISGLFLQYVFALTILRVPVVRSVFHWTGDVITLLVKFSKEGGRFLFGDISKSSGFVFHLIPLIAFIVSLLAILEHLGVLHTLLKILGRFLAFCTGASPAEALNASANIFMGPVDSVMVIRPYLKHVTPSEIHCLMANAMSTVTGSIIGLYIVLGISADHLLAASVMSAPAALSVAKLAVPETKKRPGKTLEDDMDDDKRYRSVMDAASSGAIGALTLGGAIIANVTAVISFMEMINAALRWLGGLVNVQNFTLQVGARFESMVRRNTPERRRIFIGICSYLFYPLALSQGVDVPDAHRVAELLGIKVFINELVAYAKLGQYRKNRLLYEDYLSQNFTEWSMDDVTKDVFLPGWNVTLHEGFLSFRSEVITTYALCGFANFISVGVIVGCYLVLVPHRKMVVFQFVIRSMVVGHCASFLTACVAGLFLH